MPSLQLRDRPVNAIPDYGINLRRKDFQPWSTPVITNAAPWLGELIELNERLHSLFCPNKPGRLKAPRTGASPEEIKKIVAVHFGRTRAEMEGPSKRITLVRPRQIAIYICVRYARATTIFTGKLFGGRDHSTVCHAVTTIQIRIATESVLAADVLALIHKCGYEE